MRCAVAGAGGAIGGHLTGRLLADGHQVWASDSKPLSAWWQRHDAAANLTDIDCSTPKGAAMAVAECEWVFDLAETMGGISFITSEKVACAESIEIGINLLRESAKAGVQRFFFASSACIYRADQQDCAVVEGLREGRDDWPADPEPGYGLCKLYMEELCRHYREDGRLDTRIARYHNVFMTHGSWTGGKEKSPAALARKVAEAEDGTSIEVWGDGQQTRSYCYVDDAVEGTLRLMASDYPQPVNIGSDRLVTVDDLARIIIGISGKKLAIEHVEGPQGVRGRNSCNDLVRQVLGWEPSVTLEDGLAKTYAWVLEQTERARLA